jgi:ferrous iron transport protein B
MSATAVAGTITVALVGNPNTGKSTLFNALVGVRQRVGNYPGVTVEKRTGRTEIDGVPFAMVDLPGTYSLAPRSPDEMIAVAVLLGRRDDVPLPNVVLCIVDASNLERNLYLVSQVLELERPVVVALNMVDVATDRGVSIDIEQLRARLGVPVIATQAHRKVGLPELRAALSAAAGSARRAPPSPFPQPFCAEVTALEEAICQRSGAALPRYLVERLLLDTSGYLREGNLPGIDAAIVSQIEAARERLAAANLAVPAIEAMARYEWVGKVLEGVVTRRQTGRVTLSDRIDRVLTHKVFGSILFVLLMIVVFQSIFTWSAPAMAGIEWGVERLSDLVTASLPPGALRSLLTGGVIAGAGSVLVFLPQILVLFLFIAVLEECGYMARAAYLMDKLMSRIGLSGKSFIPLLSSFACAVPGIMAARVIENRRERLVTILIAPLMSCSARLPVYMLLIAAFIPEWRFLGGWVSLQGLVMLGLYALGIATAVAVALVLNRTIFRGVTPPFVMELPGYKLPSVWNVLRRALDQGWSFVYQAGTMILAVTIVVWAAAFFPHPLAVERQIRDRYQDEVARLRTEIERLETPAAAANTKTAAAPDRRGRLAAARQELAAVDTRISGEVAGAYLAQSYLGRLGRLIEPVVKPLGWDWRIGCAVIASFPAREVVIGTLGVIYDLGERQDEQSRPLRKKLASATWPGSDRPVFTVPVALSLMVFFALCAQCSATLIMIRREAGGWRWSALTFFYMTGLAYLGALVVYQTGSRFF